MERRAEQAAVSGALVNRIYTDLAILDVRDKELHVVELAPGVDFAKLQRHTQANLVTTRVPRTA